MIDENGVIHVGNEVCDFLWGRFFSRMDKRLPEGKRMRPTVAPDGQ